MSDNNQKLIALLPGEELNEQRVSAMSPVLRYVVQLSKPAQVVFDVKEANTASRTALYLSQAEDFPSAKNASWSCESSKPHKTVVLLPIDERFRVGPCYLSVCYTGSSGVSFFKLRVTMKEQYVARWSFSASMSIYDGEWQLDRRQGRGRAVYYDDAKGFEVAVANSVPTASSQTNKATDDQATLDAVNAATESIDTQVRLLAQSYLGATSKSSVSSSSSSSLSPSSAAAAASKSKQQQQQQRRGQQMNDAAEHHQLQPQVVNEWYEGDWVANEKDGDGVYVWNGGEMRYEGHWKSSQRCGKGVLTAPGGTYTGEWRNDMREGFGVQLYNSEQGSGAAAANDASSSRYEGMWQQNERHGAGVFTYGGAKGIRISGTWRNDELLMPVKAEFPATGETYEGEWKNDAPHGKGVLKTEGLIYDGEFFNGKKHGKGVWRLPRGIDFDGKWENDGRGFGQFTFPSTGDIYQGEWDEKKHRREGQGICVYGSSGGGVYKGAWQADQRHGHGELKENGEVYVGEFFADLRHGQGTATYAEDGGHQQQQQQSGAESAGEGGEYTGSWYRGKRHGYGVHQYPDGSSYEGEWCEGEYEGQGRMVVNNATARWEYNGQWQRSVRSGLGSVIMYLSETREDGTERTESYRGYWRENRREGEGTIFYANGDEYTGEWRDNARVDGRGTLKNAAEGSVYVGNFKHEKPHGQGIKTYKNGSRHDGAWSNGVPHGEGTLYMVSPADVFVAKWDRGRPVDGPGNPCKIIHRNGNIYEGEFVWRDGKPVPSGQGSLVYLDSTAFEGTFVNGCYRL